MPYNLTLNGTGLVPAFQDINSNILFSQMGTGILILIGAIFLFAYYHKSEDFPYSLGLTSLILVVVSILLFLMNLATDLHIWVTAILAAMAGLMYFLTNK